MAHKKNNGTSKEVFCLTLPLCCEPWQRDRLDKVFHIAHTIKNNLIANRLKALRQMERSREWRAVQGAIRALYETVDGTPTKEQSERLRELYTQRADILKQHQFSEYSFHFLVKRYRNHYLSSRAKVGSHIAQKIASSVWKAFEDYLFGSGKAIHFSKWTEFTTIEGNRNVDCIIYRSGYIRTAGMVIPVKMNRTDKYGYEREALSREVRYCRITRRWYPDGWRYFAQLVLTGAPPIKVIPETGELLHPLGTGRVGIDIGPQTVAVVGDKSVYLGILAERVQDIQNELRLINRGMDRSRRATNPAYFDKQGRIIPHDRLPRHLLHPNGKRIWNKSKRYKRFEGERRYLLGKQAILRKLCHHELANMLLSFGDEYYIEKMNFAALAKRAKGIRKNDRGKCLSNKRFGKSVANRAPAMFVDILEQKVVAAGGVFHRINTTKAKASQYNHETKAYKKKQLSQRWNYMPSTNTKVQRDLYSAFLLQQTNEALDGFIQGLLETKFPSFLRMHDEEIVRLTSSIRVSSMGIR